jgi:hypothetical protein
VRRALTNKQYIQASRVAAVLSFNRNMPRAPHGAPVLGPKNSPRSDSGVLSSGGGGVWSATSLALWALREADRRRMDDYSVREKQGLVPDLQLDDSHYELKGIRVDSSRTNCNGGGA